MEHATPTRRQVMRAGTFAACGVAGAGLLAACGSDDDETPDAASSPSAATSAAASTPAAAAGGRIIALADVPAGSAVSAKTPDGAEIVVYRPETGDPVAFSAVCPHAGTLVAPTTEGVLLCPAHKSRFAEATGEVVNGPADKPLSKVAVAVSGTDIVTA